MGNYQYQIAARHAVIAAPKYDAAEAVEVNASKVIAAVVGIGGEPGNDQVKAAMATKSR
jgi:hypothetical protein